MSVSQRRPTHRRFRRLAVVALSCLAFCSVTLSISQAAMAQEANATYTAEQQKLNEDGVRAIISKDYALAIAVLEESAAIGELNITYLNLGRAYQKMGDCEAAREAYERAETAPKVSAPSPAVVAKKLEEYTAELATECEAKKDAAPAQSDEAADAQTADAQAADRQEVAAPDDAAGAEADKPAEARAPSNTELGPVASTEPHKSSMLGWTLTGTGVAVMGAGIGALLWADSLRGEISGATRNEQGHVISMTRPQALEHESRAATLDAVGVGMTIGGALLTTGGLYLLLSEDGEAGTSVSLRTGAERIRVVWTHQF